MARTKPVTSTKKTPTKKPEKIPEKSKQVLNKIPRKDTEKTLLSPTDRIRLQIKNLNNRTKELESSQEKLDGTRARFEAQIQANRGLYDSLRHDVRSLTLRVEELDEQVRRINERISDPKFGARPRKRRH